MSHYPTPEPGTVYQHYSNGLHEIIGTAYEWGSLAERVVYRSLTDGQMRLISPHLFFQEVTTKNGQKVPRFSLVELAPVATTDPSAATNRALSEYREVPNQEAT